MDNHKMTATLPDRARELYARLAENILGMSRAFCELRDYGYRVDEIYKTLSGIVPNDDDLKVFKAAIFDLAAHYGITIPPDPGVHDGVHEEPDQIPGVELAIQTVLCGAASATCAVNLRSGLMLQGDLFRTEWGQLRLVSTAAGKTVEYFFDYDDICVVAREISPRPGDHPSLIVKS